MFSRLSKNWTYDEIQAPDQQVKMRNHKPRLDNTGFAKDVFETACHIPGEEYLPSLESLSVEDVQRMRWKARTGMVSLHGQRVLNRVDPRGLQVTGVVGYFASEGEVQGLSELHQLYDDALIHPFLVDSHRLAKADLEIGFSLPMFLPD